MWKKTRLNVSEWWSETTKDRDPEKSKKTKELETRLDELEQYTRMDDSVVSGLVTTHCCYARVAAGVKDGEDAPSCELHSLEQQVIKLFNNKDIPLDDKKNIYCSMWHYSSKAEHMKENCKTCQQETQNWTVKAHKEAQRHWSICKWKADKQKFWDCMRARTLEKEKWIQGTCTRSCKVVVQLNGTPEQAKILTTVYGKWKIWIDTNNGDCGEVVKIMSFFCYCGLFVWYTRETILEHDN